MTVLQALDLHKLAQIPAASLLNTAAEGIGIAILAWALLRFTRRHNAGTRFAVWFFALLAIACLPFVAASGGRGAEAVRATVTVSSSWAIYLLAGWAVVSSLCMLRLVLGLWQVRRLRQDCQEVDIRSLDVQLVEVMKDAPRGVKLCVSSLIKAPAAIGFFRPAVVVPAWALSELSLDQLKVTLLHELAHLRRFDDWTNLTQKIVKAIFFFHPAVWWIEGRLNLEREMACDDLVLEQTGNPKAYAASLIAFAEKIHRGRELALVHAFVGRVKQISQRVTRILDAKRPRATRMWAPVMGLVTVMSGAVLAGVPYAPQLISFQDTAPAPVLARHVSSPVIVEPVVLKQASAPRQNQGSAVPAKLKTRSLPAPRVMVARATNSEQQPPDMTMVMRSVSYDEHGSQVLTLCIWRVTEGKQGQRQIETMYVVSKI